MENIEQITKKLLELNKQILKQKEINSNNKRTEIYEQNKNYLSYEDEIISGENVIDCINENIKHQEFILNKYEQLLIEINTKRNKMIENIETEIQEQEQNFK